MKGVPSPAQRQVLWRLRQEGGVVERRRGGLGSRFWNNYWTAASQPATPGWYAQGHTILSLIEKGMLVVVASGKDGPTRCQLSEAAAVQEASPAVVHG